MEKYKWTILLMACLFLPIIPMIVAGMDMDDYPIHLVGTIGVLLLWSAVLCLSRGRFRKTMLAAIFALTIVPYLINIGWFAISGELLHNNRYWVIFDSNPHEMSGFLQTVPWYAFLLIAVAFAVITFLFVMAMRESGSSPALKSRNPRLIKAIVVLLFILPVFVPVTRRRGAPINFYSSFNGYITDIRKMKEFMSNRPNLDGQVKRTERRDSTTIIVVIGESFSRSHSSLYGYQRQTNPRLMSIKDSLLIFRNVTSPDFMTQVCVTQMLTFPGQRQSDQHRKSANTDRNPQKRWIQDILD